MTFNLTYKRFGERAILVEWPAVIDVNTLKDIVKFKNSIEKKNIKSIVELNHAYNSLLISYHSVCRNFENDIKTLKSIYLASDFTEESKSVLWKIPVCYNTCFGIDLEVISKEKKTSKEDIIKRHYHPVYTVYFIGFLPGFLYLGGLDASLCLPRKQTPRLNVEKGAVAIGGSQTGVYPTESPGGWNIIGKSPVEFFDPNLEPPCFAKAGDKISFMPISIEEFKSIRLMIAGGTYKLESEVVHD